MATSALPFQSLLRRIVTRSPSGLGQIGDLEGDQLGATERAGEAQGQQRAVPGGADRVSGQSASICFSTSAVAGAFPSLAAPMVRRMPRRTALTPFWLVGGS